MGTPTRTRRVSAQTKAIWTLLLATVICLFVPASALAAASYVFEPTLSSLGPPTGHLESPGVTTDAYGDIYVADITEAKGRIEVFGPNGSFITKFNDPAGPQSIAVDSEGNVYAFERISGGNRQISLFSPTVYKPLAGEIEYAKAPVVIADEVTKKKVFLSPWDSLAVDSSDHLYVDDSTNVTLFGSAKEGNEVLEKDILEAPKGGGSALVQSTSMAIDAVHGKIYFSDAVTGSSTVRVFDLGAMGKKRPELKEDEIDGSQTPSGHFLSTEGFLRVDVDDSFGHVFVLDPAVNLVYEFEEDGTYLATIEHNFQAVPNAQIAVDDGPKNPHPQQEGWLLVPSDPAPSVGHIYAFEPKENGPPAIEEAGAEGVTETEAVLHARINPNSLPTEYLFQYITQQQFEEEAESFANATTAREGTLSPSGEGVDIGPGVRNLQPGTAYRFRVFAENEEGKDEKEAFFTTFEAAVPPPHCENEAMRTGPSTLLPDCRAYELVTPPSTNGRSPSSGFGGIWFPTLEASQDGSRMSYMIEGGSLPGEEGTGLADLQLATRGSDGWGSQLAGPTGAEAPTVFPGSVSPDQTYSFWSRVAGVDIRYPDGHSELVGRGSLGEDPSVNARLITENASHIIFTSGAGSAVQLEPDAPPAKTATIYDRPAEGSTHVVSLLPGNVTPGAGQNAVYLGASEEGEGIAFSIGGTIYLRLHSEETFKVVGPGATFAGVADEGKRVFYLEGGNLYAFDAEAEEAIAFSSSGDVTPVNVASGGTSAYFVSPSALTSEPSPNGELAKPTKEGAQNLYLSEEGQLSFVGLVTKRDVEGENSIAFGLIDGLGLWVESLPQSAPAKDSSRTTPSGSTLLFESRTDLSGFKSGGVAQVYRYDSAQGRLTCLSCSPTSAAPTSDASLQSIGTIAGDQVKIANQSPDGRRAFFQTAEPLTVGDTDGRLDVYEWEEKGTGSCGKQGGCVYLISGGHGTSADYLYAMSGSGDDVFFGTTDTLLLRDAEATLSIYDARVKGGFLEESCREGCCGGGDCRPQGSGPDLPQPTTSAIGPDGNITPKHCPKGKHVAERHGEEVCVKNRHKKKHRRGTGSKKKGGLR